MQILLAIIIILNIIVLIYLLFEIRFIKKMSFKSKIIVPPISNDNKIKVVKSKNKIISPTEKRILDFEQRQLQKDGW